MEGADFSGGPVVKNPACSGGDTGWIPVWEDSMCFAASKPTCCNY